MTRPNIWKKFFFAFLLCAETAIVSNAQSFTTLASFDLSDGSFPEASLVQGADGNLYGTTYFGGGNCKSSGGCGTVFKITPHGKLTRLYSFCNLALCADGNDPGASLLLATNGEFYSTTVSGGAANCGTLFKITAAGALATLHTFEISDGCSVTEAVIQAAD